MRKKCLVCGRDMKRGYEFTMDGVFKYWRCPACAWSSKTKSNIKNLFNDREFLPERSEEKE